MANLSQGQSASLVLNPGDSYSISTTGTATVRGAYGAPTSTTTLTAQTQTFGPYGANAKLEIVAVSGSASYNILAPTGFSYEEERQVKALVSGDGSAGPSQTFANALATVAADVGKTTRITNVGKPGAGTLMISDGVNLLPLNGRSMLLRLALPFVLPPNGSFAANGALTLGAALDRIYTQCYMYFPAAAIHAASAAGWYYTVMSSTTVGTVYTNTYVSGWPSVPAAPGGFVVAGSGAFTQTANVDIPGPQVTVPGNLLGAFGGVETRLLGVGANTANVKAFRLFYGTGQFQVLAVQANNTYINGLGGFTNMGVSAQKQTHGDSSAGVTGSVSATIAYFNIDSTVDKTLSATLKIPAGSGATDWLVLHELRFEHVAG